jgi:hypothetical protein
LETQQQEQQELSPLEQEISAHAAAIEQTEQQALQIDERLKRLSGLSNYLGQSRGYGVIRNPWIENNITVQTQIAREDRELAVWMASKAGITLPPVDYAAQEAEQQRQAAIQRMQEQTLLLREQRIAQQEANQHRLIYGYAKPQGGQV